MVSKIYLAEIKRFELLIAFGSFEELRNSYGNSKGISSANAFWNLNFFC
jgi:hypothetical protein